MRSSRVLLRILSSKLGQAVLAVSGERNSVKNLLQCTRVPGRGKQREDQPSAGYWWESQHWMEIFANNWLVEMFLYKYPAEDMWFRRNIKTEGVVSCKFEGESIDILILDVWRAAHL